ncbi:MAG: deoxyadenosine kinase [Deltaproteobacteria bacterium GWB2_65_81]|nr:MAG: deoxyadenosine kinase [Deltaproteobacteria bacterium GWA2_65_63]OGP27956.1 MAG: deoxyadenosine kinase [Deltaproteobacteria bacterium GWB2_65_81]OGP37046.1 MAG: deoxyadenosine kinase [Deltaproteobacteria bacterium GWC2_66_88]HAM32966.1 deoxynucleoside kinase [Deltaproteobacteria bacterium]
MTDPKIPRYLAIEGPIGVGKSSLAKILAQKYGSRLVKEEVEANPFLERFYENPRKYAFQTQLFFLLSRYRQQRELVQGDLFETGVVCDYILAKDKIFALINLEDDEISLYESIYKLLVSTLPKPDLVIYLQARPEVLLSRVRKRGIAYERNISLDYLRTLSDAYNEYFFHYNETPLLVVGTSEIDFVESPRDLEHLVREVKSVKRGTQHYIPLGSR